MSANIQVDRNRIADFCRRHHIRRLALFGSVLGDDFRPDSDVDVLVEFERDFPVGYLTFAGIARELSELLGRPADVHTWAALKPRIRQAVEGTAEMLYAA